MWHNVSVSVGTNVWHALVHLSELVQHSAHDNISDKMFWTPMVSMHTYIWKSLWAQESKSALKKFKYDPTIIFGHFDSYKNPVFEFFEGKFRFLSSQIFQNIWLPQM